MTRHFPFMQVDAFTRRRLEGNPCAVVFDADGLDDATMLAIAREMNLAETSFVLSPRKSDFRARYFTLDGEIPLAGHPTVATVHALIESGQLVMGDGPRTISLEIGAGVIDVDVEIEDTTRVTMTQMKPQFLDTVALDMVLETLGLEAADLIPDVPLQVVSTGTPQLMVPAVSLDVLRRARPNLEALSRLKRGTEATCVHLFCRQGATDDGDTFARDFDAPPEIIEDPFTGSATGGMAAYLWHYGLIDEPAFIAQQGHWLGRPGNAFVEVVGPRDDIETVRVGGYAVTTIAGELII
ncbi:MAG: PhzF family phenazine biosynthesis protein [Alphaproteobacteria bacterium]